MTAKSDYIIRIRSLDAIVDYNDNTFYALPNKFWKDKSLYKFLYLFMEHVLNIPKFKIVNNIEEMDKLVNEAQEKEKNVRFMEIGVISFLPTIAVFKYNIILPKHLMTEFSRDYYNKWKYAVISDINVNVEDSKNQIRRTEVDLISFRRGKLNLQQLKKMIVDEIQKIVEDKRKLLILDDEGEKKFDLYVKEVLLKYLFPTPQKKKDNEESEEKENSEEQ
jgi:hypothetical protein